MVPETGAPSNWKLDVFTGIGFPLESVAAVKRLLNWAAVIDGVASCWTIGSAWADGAAKPRVRPVPSARASVILFITSDLPGLIRGFAGPDEPFSCESVRNSPTGERLRTGPAGRFAPSAGE